LERDVGDDGNRLILGWPCDMIGSCSGLPVLSVARVFAGSHIGWKPRQTASKQSGALKSFVKKANKITKARR